MRRTVLTIVAVAALSIITAQTAFTADVPAPVYKAQPAETSYDWSGFYLGINGGGAWGRSRHDFDVGTTTGNYNVRGGMIGGTVGYNWQAPGNMWVVGVEWDSDWTHLRGSAQCPGPLFTCGTRSNWLTTARGRLGWSRTNWLLYATGGGAFGEIKETIAGPFSFPGHAVTRAGWTAGAGVEVGMFRNWSVKAEYLYVDLGTATCSIPNCAPSSNDRVPLRANVARAGINYRW